ncbi:GntR family transcriptional regulator [Aliiglaciecola sp. 3_MG-2023]|uniref:GntR family transcriptional regulator n=1 Tax=Aliiglaciecola sp. 3_MG-2023 TaxID=3062644 RepID=UPI0026E303E4|nr:GntR family transcriptional regulator [Aliiglaciecola sp. 3_MG-2023]MDO6695317.1 GntR family transcriptional regulator [Aliiglaciecola sp. 3_MG-2023]
MEKIMSGFHDISEGKVSLSDEAYLSLKESILNGDIAKGATYTQSEIVKTLGIAISPLRAAINKLETEGLIKVLPRSGIQIIDTDFALTRNTYQLRVILEREGLKSYIRSATDEEINNFRQKHIALRNEINSCSSNVLVCEKLAKLDSELHNAFILSLNNQIITKNYLANEDLIRLTRLDRVDLASNEMLLRTNEEHLTLIDAIADRDPVKALESLDTHLEKSIKRAMGLWGF